MTEDSDTLMISGSLVGLAAIKDNICLCRVAFSLPVLLCKPKTSEHKIRYIHDACHCTQKATMML